ncbi:hypothetical protein BJV82DRAFT_674321 [Fennellomyces sp. T-0311]|nr:hypothetical protein BJV82DRAFT_674321 [Fennellomyces sp. T-0311]
MSFWSPNSEFSSGKLKPHDNDSTPLAMQDYAPDLDDTPDHQALLLGNDIDNDPSDQPPTAPRLVETLPRYHVPFETYSHDDRILSRDQQVNVFSQELYSFLRARSAVPPRIAIHFKGTRNPRIQYRRTYDSNGNILTEEQEISKEGPIHPIEEFNYRIDCSDLVSRRWAGFHVLPDRKTGRVKTVEELCEDYVKDTHKLKELQLTKVIDWDEELLIRTLTAGIRANGYSNTLNITIEKKETKVTVKPGSWLARMADNVVVRAFFYSTLLFIFTWPMLLLWRRKIGHKTLQSKWHMTVSEKDWCDQHMAEIIGQIPPAALGRPVRTEDTE